MKTTSYLFAHSCVGNLQHPHDEPEQPNGRAEDLHNQDAHKQGRVCCVGQRRSAAHNADRHATEEVGEAHGEATAEDEVGGEQVAREHFLRGGVSPGWVVLQDSSKNNGDDKPIDGHGFAEDDGDQVLGFDARGAHPSPDDADAGGVDAQSGAHHRQGDGEADARSGVHVGRDVLQQPANGQPLSLVCDGVANRYGNYGGRVYV